MTWALFASIRQISQNVARVNGAATAKREVVAALAMLLGIARDTPRAQVRAGFRDPRSDGRQLVEMKSRIALSLLP